VLSLLPQGEGQDEGTNKTVRYLSKLPHPNPLPGGEGVNGTAVMPVVYYSQLFSAAFDKTSKESGLDGQICTR